MVEMMIFGALLLPTLTPPNGWVSIEERLPEGEEET